MCCCANVKLYKTRTCNSTKSRCQENPTWKHGKNPKLSLSMTFVACVTCLMLFHIFCEHIGSISELALSKISCHLWTGKRAGWTCAYTDRNLFVMMVDHKRVGLVHAFSSQLQSTNSSFVFRLFCKQKSELSKVSVWWKVVRQVAMPVIYIQRKFLGTWGQNWLLEERRV